VDQKADEILRKVRVPYQSSQFSEYLKQKFRNGSSISSLSIANNYAQLLHSNLLHSFHLYENGWSCANEPLKSTSIVDSIANRVGLQLTEQQLKVRQALKKDTKTEFYKSKLK